MEPTRHAIDVEVMENDPNDTTQASIGMTQDFAMNYFAENRRVLLSIVGSTPPTKLSVNYQYATEHPEEMRGVLFHEFGHLWTQKANTAVRGNHAFIEGIAELMRTAAARKEHATWHQACGGTGFQILNERDCPLIAAGNSVEYEDNFSVAAKYITCNRLISHLGHLDDQVLGGIARACSYSSSDRSPVQLAALVHDIERETGRKGFAERCFNDPVICPGKLEIGEIAIALMNLASSNIHVSRFEVLGTGESFNWSRKQYETIPPNVALDEIDRDPIRTRMLEYKLKGLD